MGKRPQPDKNAGYGGPYDDEVELLGKFNDLMCHRSFPDQCPDLDSHLLSLKGILGKEIIHLVPGLCFDQRRG